jgi:preprotein translocase subunit SecB
MQTTEQPKIKFLGVSIANVHLTVFNQSEEEQQVELNVDAKLFPRDEGSKSFKIWMTVELSVSDFWEIRVAGVGEFEFGDTVTTEDQTALINVNAPAIMFPYFRSFISTLTVNCGGSVPISIIPPHFFSGKMESLTLPEEMKK